MSKDDQLYLVHILDSAERILEYTRDGRENFLASKLLQDAVERNFEIIGEASKRVSTPLREEFPGVPWREMAGFRDVLIHGYDHVIASQVWKAVEAHVPPQVHSLDEILKAKNWPRGPPGTGLQP